jgi:hypothetical protein
MERLSWSQKLERSLMEFAGEEICQAVMQGGEGMRSADTPGRKADWVRERMARLDAQVPDLETRRRILQACSCNFQKRKDGARKLYLQAGDVDGFLELLAGQRWIFGGVLEQEADGRLYAVYTRCDCGWVKSAKAPISGTYCMCAEGYLSGIFSAAVGKPVGVELEESIIQGAESCRFRVMLEDNPSTILAEQ